MRTLCDAESWCGPEQRPGQPEWWPLERILDLIALSGETSQMPKTRKTASAPARINKAARSTKTRSVSSSQKKSKAKLPAKKRSPGVSPEPAEHAQILESKVAYQGPLFRVTKDKIIEPSGKESQRDVIRHNGSVVIVAVDSSKSKTDPWVVIERQYRHAANRYLWELPAGTL